jgi:hypothetical protein
MRQLALRPRSPGRRWRWPPPPTGRQDGLDAATASLAASAGVDDCRRSDRKSHVSRGFEGHGSRHARKRQTPAPARPSACPKRGLRLRGHDTLRWVRRPPGASGAPSAGIPHAAQVTPRSNFMDCGLRGNGAARVDAGTRLHGRARARAWKGWPAPRAACHPCAAAATHRAHAPAPPAATRRCAAPRRAARGRGQAWRAGSPRWSSATHRRRSAPPAP